MSLDFPIFEKMKRECPRAAWYWRAGDVLYYLGLISGVFSLSALVFMRSLTAGVFLLASGAVLALGMFLKRKSYAIARQAGITFD